MLDHAPTQTAWAATTYLSAQPANHQQRQLHPQQENDSDDEALTPGNARVLMQTEFPRSHDLDCYLADDGAGGQPAEGMLGLQVSSIALPLPPIKLCFPPISGPPALMHREAILQS